MQSFRRRDRSFVVCAFLTNAQRKFQCNSKEAEAVLMTTIKFAGRAFLLMEEPPSHRNWIHLLHCIISGTGTMGSKGGFVLPLPRWSSALCQRWRKDSSKSFFLRPPPPSPLVNKEIAFASKLYNIFLLRDVKLSLKSSGFQATENGVYPTNCSGVLPGTGLRFCCCLWPVFYFLGFVSRSCALSEN